MFPCDFIWYCRYLPQTRENNMQNRRGSAISGILAPHSTRKQHSICRAVGATLMETPLEDSTD